MAVQAPNTTKTVYENGFPKKPSRMKYNFPINERLKKARHRKGISCRAVVKELGKKGISIGHSTLQGYEADEKSLNHRYPSLNVLKELTDFYGCSMDYLLGFTDQFEIQKLNTEIIDIRDLLDSNISLRYNGVKLTGKKLADVKLQLDLATESNPKY